MSENTKVALPVMAWADSNVKHGDWKRGCSIHCDIEHLVNFNDRFPADYDMPLGLKIEVSPKLALLIATVGSIHSETAQTPMDLVYDLEYKFGGD